MPQNLSIAAFVLGAILLLVAIVGGGFKLFGAEIPAAFRLATGKQLSFSVFIFLL